MKALTIWQPWVWAIMHAGKRLENRGWYCHYRGPILLHAAKRYDPQEIVETMVEITDVARESGLKVPQVTLRELQASCGHLLATANVVGCIRPGGTIPEGQDGWYMGSYALVLADVRPLPRPIAFRGQQGLFEVPETVLNDEPKPIALQAKPIALHGQQGLFDVPAMILNHEE